MTGRAVRATAIAAVITACAALAIGCTPRNAGTASSAPTGAVSATASEGATTSVAATQAAGAGAVAAANGATSPTGKTPSSASSKSAKADKVDLKGIDAQLQAMQKELDGLNMPSDSDFNGAAGAVY